MDEKQKVIDKLRILEERDNVARERQAKYKNMTYAQVLQEPENKHRLKEVECMQRSSFMHVIKKRDELKHLKKEKDDLFCEYWMGFLKGEFVSINDFLYEDRLSPVEKRVLRENLNK